MSASDITVPLKSVLGFLTRKRRYGLTEAMGGYSRIAWAVALMLCCELSGMAHGKEQVVHEKTYHSSVLELGPGDVINTYRLLEVPEGHIALRSLFGELVDEDDVPVPLTEVYLHHWDVRRHFVKKGSKQLAGSVFRTVDVGASDSEHIAFQEDAEDWRALEDCPGEREIFDFGIGSETRHTNSSVPPPYGHVFGDADAVPEGFEEIWVLNVHAINTVDTLDPRKCLECFCDSYGLTHDARGNLLPKDYIGGRHCCFDNTHCAVKGGVQRVTKKYSFKYVLTWVDWDESVVPLRTYRFDVTDSRTSLIEKSQCDIEYTVPQCVQGTSINQCVDHRHSIQGISVGGDMILGVLHQHLGGLGGVLYNDDGTVLCVSEPIYGQGIEAGNEAGYVVGMSSCYPEPGTVTIESMKELHFDAYYNNEVQHTGVMSVFVVHVADPVTRIKKVTG